MKSIYEKVELVANVAIIVVTILLGTILVRSYLLPHSAPMSQQTPSTRGVGVGQSVNMKDVNWQQNGKTLLLVLSSSCHFCTESAPFYQKLISESTVRLIAALPQDVDEGKAYLEKLGVPINDVRQVSLKSIKAAGTPTLLLVDHEGHISGEWIGKLSPEQEAEVLKQVRAGTDSY